MERMEQVMGLEYASAETVFESSRNKLAGMSIAECQTHKDNTVELRHSLGA